MRLIIILLFAIFLHQSHAATVEAQKHTSKKTVVDEQIGTSKKPLFVKTEIIEDKEKISANQIKEKLKDDLERETSEYTYRASIATIGIFIVTLIQAGLFLWQLFLMRKATEISAIAAKAAQAAVQVSHTSFLADHRPWVHINGIEVHKPPFKDSGRFLIPLSITLENVGNTPALQVWPVIYASDGGFTDINPTDVQNRIVDNGPNQNGGIAIFPNSKTKIEVYAVMQEDLDRFGTVTMIWPSIVGVIFYKNTTGETWHRTGFIYNTFVERSNDRDYLINLDSLHEDNFPIRLQLSPQGDFAD
jgi:hypothetical protein